MERWEEIYKNTIPVGSYQTLISNGEAEGLIIKLESIEYLVKIYFGVVSAVRMLDEGILLTDEIFDDNEFSRYLKNKFSNTIYKIHDGEFGNLIRKTSNVLYDYLGLKHYVIITMNYIIEVITEWAPSIEVLKIGSKGDG